ncbi:hypothetical protein BN2537_5797 [Streptomyces venezuelae]|nr:hypothetical protein BN2537_5797 [Streptomyces venezuelae]
MSGARRMGPSMCRRPNPRPWSGAREQAGCHGDQDVTVL